MTQAVKPCKAMAATGARVFGFTRATPRKKSPSSAIAK